MAQLASDAIEDAIWRVAGVDDGEDNPDDPLSEPA
jgi:hypothetical protein